MQQGTSINMWTVFTNHILLSIHCSSEPKSKFKANSFSYTLDVNKNTVNPFTNTPFWDRPKFKEAADDNWNVAIKGF